MPVLVLPPKILERKWEVCKGANLQFGHLVPTPLSSLHYHSSSVLTKELWAAASCSSRSKLLKIIFIIFHDTVFGYRTSSPHFLICSSHYFPIYYYSNIFLQKQLQVQHTDWGNLTSYYWNICNCFTRSPPFIQEK